MNNEIEIAELGGIQLIDIMHSHNEHFDSHFRTCTVMQGDPPISDIGDTSPHRIARLYGEDWSHWNRQFVAQVAECPMRCWYCYVDNLEPGIEFTPRELVLWYREFKRQVSDLHVFHFMGGCPGRYSYLWKEIRNEMDKQGCEDDVFLTDVILVENKVYDVEPWNDIPHMSIVQVCLKGTNFDNFRKNTRTDLFHEAVSELHRYIGKKQVYFALIEQSDAGTEWAAEMLGVENIDFLEVKEYEVVKERKAGWIR